MAVNDPRRIPESQRTFEGGVNSGVEPVLIAPNQLSWAVNSTQRGGFPKQRPGIVKRTLQFSDPYIESSFLAGLFQGAGSYVSTTKTGYACCSIAGRIYTINISGGYQVADITIPGDPSGSTQPHAWFLQAERYLLVSDNQSRTFAWNGASAIRCNPDNQVPVCGPMAYIKGRVWAARGSLYFGGDLVGNDPALGVDNVIYFTENTYLNEGGAFSVQGGDITGLAASANLDSTLGFGDLLIFNRSNAFAFDVPLDRTTWTDLTYPVQRFGLIGSGSANHESIAIVNGDCFFRSTDGIRSYIIARRDFGMWGNTPISREVIRAIKNDYSPLLYAASAVNFDNRYLCTCDPHWVYGHGVWHSGLVSINFDLVSSLTGKSNPAWEGVWTGLRILHILTVPDKGEKRCFIFALSADNEIEFWELTKDAIHDFDGTQDIRIQHDYEFRSFMAGLPETKKRLDNLSVWEKEISGIVDATAFYRPETTDGWIEWGTFEWCASKQVCSTPEDCQPPDQFHPLGVSRQSTGQPKTLTDGEGTPWRECYEAQIRLVVNGPATLKRVQVSFEQLPETLYGSAKKFTCSDLPQPPCDTDCMESKFCPVNDYAYHIN